MIGDAAEAMQDDDDMDETLYAPEEKFANPRDHMGRTATDVKSLCDQKPDCKCPACGHKLLVRGGEKIATHFFHAPGREDAACRGAFETPWHRAAKFAAGMRPGWLHEYTDKTDRHSRFDAFNQFTNEAFEAVHSLSGSYVDKQRSLMSMGYQSQWLFDSLGDFANRNPLPLDVDKAVTSGLLECHDLLTKKAIDVIVAIGPERCYLHYLGMAWRWVGIDRWQVCSQPNEMQRICCGEHGLNRMLIEWRARGDMPKNKLTFRNGELVSTAWQEINPASLLAAVNDKADQLLESWRRIKRNREYSRRRKNARQYRPSTAEDISERSKPVCEVIAERDALTQKLEGVECPSFSRDAATDRPSWTRSWVYHMYLRNQQRRQEEATDGR